MHQTAATERAEAQEYDQFLYLLCHDLGASVRALTALPEWIVEDLEDLGVANAGPVAKSIELMNRHTKRLDRMVTELQSYAQIGRMQDVVCVDIGEALDAALAQLAMPESMILTRHIGCRHVMMGAQDAQLVWRALIGNAVKHHHGEVAKICVSTREKAGMIHISVSDDGPGIGPEHLLRALEPLTTLRSRDEGEGAGMGLAQVRKIARYYGGTLELSAVSGNQSGLRVNLAMPYGVQGVA